MSTKPNRRLFITRRFILPPTPASDLLIPVLVSLLLVVIGTILHITAPSQSFYSSGKDYQTITYEYYPSANNFLSIAARSTASIAGHITQYSKLWTFDKTSKAPFSLGQIFRDPIILGQLTNQLITTEALETSFAIDLVNQELITSLDGSERRIKFTDLEGQLNFEFSEPMFGLNPFAYKDAANIDCAATKCLALTFDDGPSEYTDRLLDFLLYSHAKVTFFVLGHRTAAFSDQISRISREGHDVGSHSWIHRNLPRFSYALVLDDLSATTNVIQSFTGQYVKFLRPPYGNVNNTVNNVAAALGQQIVLWSIDPWDWQYKDANYICDHVVDHAHPGGIVILHDIYPTSIDAVECIINRLSNDYTFVNLSALYK